MLAKTNHMLADRGYDADWSREELAAKGIMPCIPSRNGFKDPISHDAARYHQRHNTETAFARFKDWWRVAPRYDRCLVVFLSACARAAAVMFWQWVLTLLYLEFANLIPVSHLCRGY